MDNGILLRQIELRSTLHRLISVLESRQMETDPTIRGFVISDQGIIDSPIAGAATGLLTGRSLPADAASVEEAP
jgi:circadian clock protein KaiC